MTTTTIDPVDESVASTLSAALRAGTRPEHETAEHTGFVERLMAGSLSRAAYADLAAQHRLIYTELEAAGQRLRAAGEDRGLVFDELVRVPSIERDLAHLHGPDWRAKARVLPATEAYAARLRECGGSLPLYAAHAYTRYLGDLSGGQIIKRMLQRHYGFGDEGVEFYTFPEIDKLKPFKDVYRERLDALPLDTAERAAVVEEARVAFRFNAAVFSELGALHAG